MRPLPDPDRAPARLIAAEAYACWLRDHPALAGLRTRLAALAAAGATEGLALLDAAEPLLAELGWIQEALAAAARHAAADPWWEPPLRPLDHTRQCGLVLFDNGQLRISAHAVSLEKIAARKAASLGHRSVGFTGAVTAYRIVRAGGTELDLWAAPPAGACFSAAHAGRCRRAGQRVLADGMRFTLDGTREAWTIARQRGDLVFVQATAHGEKAPLAIEYDATTGAFVSAGATDGAAARTQLMATLLRQMRRTDAAPAIAALADDDLFFVRWHMARELAALSPAAAAPVLRSLADGDPHVEVRAAARSTLALVAA